MSALRNLFGPNKEAVWRQVSQEIKADFVKGGFWKSDKVEVKTGSGSIILDSYFCAASKTVHTRFRAALENPGGFRFRIYRKGCFSELAKALGMQDIEVGHAEFDRDFIIKGNDTDKLRQLFSNARIRELISAQPRLYLGLQEGDEGEQSGKLQFTTMGLIKDKERLKKLFELFAEMVNQLGSMRGR